MSKENQGEHSEGSDVKRLRIEVYDPNLGEGGRWDDINSRQVAILYLDETRGLAVKSNIDNPFIMEWFIRSMAGQMSEDPFPITKAMGESVLNTLNSFRSKEND